MKNSLIIALVLFLAACSSSNESANKNSNEMRACTTDSECISVANNCCGCTAGGSNKAINSTKQKQWSKLYLKECSQVICSTVMSKHKSCSAIPACVKGQCTLK